jgi:hypothetical protein
MNTSGLTCLNNGLLIPDRVGLSTSILLFQFFVESVDLWQGIGGRKSFKQEVYLIAYGKISSVWLGGFFLLFLVSGLQGNLS